ncbi:hypothetical protein [Delftia sp. JD2]|uniref:hypothetical protein n=1 Tax=Delftia sp. JD2 TaxID=469553 RepID=UPI001586C185|nr:hypothetical protein [Delftia sp. JD2]
MQEADPPAASFFSPAMPHLEAHFSWHSNIPWNPPSFYLIGAIAPLHKNCTTSNKCRLSPVIKKGRTNPPRTQGRALKMESMKMTASFSHLADRKEPAPQRAAVSRRYAIFISTGNRHCDF